MIEGKIPEHLNQVASSVTDLASMAHILDTKRCPLFEHSILLLAWLCGHACVAFWNESLIQGREPLLGYQYEYLFYAELAANHLVTLLPQLEELSTGVHLELVVISSSEVVVVGMMLIVLIDP